MGHRAEELIPTHVKYYREPHDQHVNVNRKKYRLCPVDYFLKTFIKGKEQIFIKYKEHPFSLKSHFRHEL